MDVSVTWQQDSAFTGTTQKGVVFPIGTSDGPSPMEMIATGLAACTGMDVISILQKKRQNVTGFDVKVHAERATDYPKVFTRITLEYIIQGVNVDPAAVERSIELSLTRYCSAHAMLAQAVSISHSYRILDSGF